MTRCTAKTFERGARYGRLNPKCTLRVLLDVANAAIDWIDAGHDEQSTLNLIKSAQAARVPSRRIRKRSVK